MRVEVRELAVNSAVGSHVSVGKAGQSPINKLYPCCNNIKLCAGDVQIADAHRFLIPHLPPAHHHRIFRSPEGDRVLAPDQERR